MRGPISGRSERPHVSAVQCNWPDEKSASATPPSKATGTHHCSNSTLWSRVTASITNRLAAHAIAAPHQTRYVRDDSAMHGAVLKAGAGADAVADMLACPLSCSLGIGIAVVTLVANVFMH